MMMLMRKRLNTFTECEIMDGLATGDSVHETISFRIATKLFTTEIEMRFLVPLILLGTGRKARSCISPSVCLSPNRTQILYERMSAFVRGKITLFPATIML